MIKLKFQSWNSFTDDNKKNADVIDHFRMQMRHPLVIRGAQYIGQ
jgi:hypothetical protein